jgi:hypothetical protein
MTAAIHVVLQRLITKVKCLVLCTRRNALQCSIDEQKRRTLWVIKRTSQRQIVASWQTRLPGRYFLLLKVLVTAYYFNKFR